MARGAVRPRRRDIFPIGYAGAAPAVGGGALLEDEANGFATDFLHPVNAERVALKTAGTVVSSGLSFFTNAGTSSKWVFNAAGTLVNVPAGQLAIDHDPVTHAAKGLLVEPAATNNQTRSSDFTVGWGGNECTITANAVTAPNGLTEGDALIPAAGSTRPFVNWTATTTAATVTTYSLFAKNGTLGNNWIELLITATPNIAAWFNLATGVTGTSTGSPISHTVTSVGNGWYRLTVTFTAGAASAATYLCSDSADGVGSGGGNGTSPAFYLWGAQMEAGTVATSYIPTAAATVTRAGDAVTVTPASINYSATAGSWWVDLGVNVVSAGARVIGYTTGSNTPIYIGNATTFSLFDPNTVSTTVGNVPGSHKLAAAFQSADRAITSDGQAPGTSAAVGTGLLSPGASIGIGCDPAGGSVLNAHIRQLRYLPRRPSNAEMQTMTT